jgi:sugar lactone lactonase YvrE
MLQLLGAILAATLPGTVRAATATVAEATPTPDSLATYVGLIGDGVVLGPSDISIGPDKSIWITDLGTDQVHQFDANGSHILTFGETGQESGQFEFADFGAIALDGDGNVFVLDTGNQRVQKFSPDLTFELEWGRSGMENGEFQHPSDIAVRDDGAVFVVDAMSGKVQQFDSSGGFVGEILPTEIATEFFEPSRLNLDSAGNLSVPDISRIYVFDPAGRHIRTIQTNETKNGTIGLAADAAVSQSGFIYVSDVQNSRIAVFDPDGKIVGYWGSAGTGTGQFVEVDALVTDDAGQILVLDFGNQRVQVFKLVESPGGTPTP